MVRKAVIFVLFAIAAPAWLVMRARYGPRFIRYLLMAWALMAGLAYLIRYQALNAQEAGQGLYLIDHWAIGAGLVYPLSGGLWGAQAVFSGLHRLAISTGDSGRPNPWYAGAFPVFPGTPRLPDLVGFWGAALFAWTLWYAPDGTLERGIALTVAPMILAFLALATSLRANDNTLPYSVPAPRAPKHTKPRTTRVLPKPRAQDGLPEVFSRRDPALKAISQSESVIARRP